MAYAEEPEAAQLGNLKLHLVAASGKCNLQFLRNSGSSTVSLQLEPPCHFHRDVRGQLRVVSHRQKIVILVESSRPNRKHAGDCDTRIQGISIISNQVVPSKVISKVALCPPFQWDEKMFVALSE